MDFSFVDPATFIWTWIAALLTLFIMSFLYKDNPIYKFAEHLFMGVSAGYWVAYQYQNVLLPKVVQPLQKAPEVVSSFSTGGIVWYYAQYIIPCVFGIMMLLRLFPKVGWISRWAIAFIVGVTAGITVYSVMEAQIISQVEDTMKSLFMPGNWFVTFCNIVLVVGVCSSLIYFYFSKEHKGVFGKISKLGIWFLMVSFGASFGFTVMARISLLIGRIGFLKEWLIMNGNVFHLFR